MIHGSARSAPWWDERNCSLGKLNFTQDYIRKVKVSAFIALLLCACGSSAPLPGEVDTQEYIFILANGRSFTHVLSADWAPDVQSGWLQINNRQRLMAMDVIMIRPRVQLDVEGLHYVRLARRNGSTAGSGLFDVWMRDGSEALLEMHRSLDLVQVAPQTWLRPNDFRLLIER